MDWLFDSIATIMDGFEGCPGFFWNDFWGHSLYWAMCDIFITAVEEVGYVSQDRLSEVLHTYDSAADGIPTILGPTWYEIFGAGAGGGILSYKCHTGEIGQWKYNEATNTSRVEIVGYEGINSILPNYCITDAFRYPMTGNWTWLLP
ncbi:MAG: hypothetical protein HXY36_00350 [Chloroflexi bacterium]|nr:hypothetical protein [Chloroflexota bacterium]